ncbi:MAG: hypothetical protein EB048_00940 [Gammaproteobacteria bacterium]|nr:hypothetical protein [Gammaproteobacteria bacterium]
MNNFDRAPDPSMVTWTHVIYALHALSVLIGVTGAATIVGSFIFGVPSIVAVVMNYARRREVRDTWLESHFSWQIRTFWIAFVASALVLVFSAPLMLVLVGFATAAIGLFLIGIWVLYRVLRGWLALRDARTLPT